MLTTSGWISAVTARLVVGSVRFPLASMGATPNKIELVLEVTTNICSRSGLATMSSVEVDMNGDIGTGVIPPAVVSNAKATILSLVKPEMPPAVPSGVTYKNFPDMSRANVNGATCASPAPPGEKGEPPTCVSAPPCAELGSIAKELKVSSLAVIKKFP